MTITHHLDDATLMSFAAGSLPAALAAVAAAHAAMCPRCRREMAALERLGGALLAGLQPIELAQAEPQAPPAAAAPRDRAGAGVRPRNHELPLPVAGLVAGGLDDVTWRWLGPGVWDHLLSIQGAGKLRLLKVAPGHNIPEHGHGGAELTLVLRGSFHDETGRYLRGDVSDLDEDIAHRPLIDGDSDCICLVGSEAPEQFHGLVARQWQRLRRF
jgi:putative transcriptional regulator